MKITLEYIFECYSLGDGWQWEKAWFYREKRPDYSVSLFSWGLSCLKRNKMRFSSIRLFYSFCYFNFVKSTVYKLQQAPVCSNSLDRINRSVFSICIWIESRLSFSSEDLFHSEGSRLILSLSLYVLSFLWWLPQDISVFPAVLMTSLKINCLMLQ